jgi:PAT family beta-lactamase induction signal transducer AmpG
MTTAAKPARNPALWVPTAYLAEGIPYAIVLSTAGSMFKDFGHSDGEITLATASIGIAWSLKPLWAAFLDLYGTKRLFVLAMEIFIAVMFGAMSLAVDLPNYFTVILAILWCVGFASATQDICIDGVYITSLDKKGQAAWIGLQGVFWTIGRLVAYGVVLWIAGTLKHRGYVAPAAWKYAFGFVAAVMMALAAYHYFLLPRGGAGREPRKEAEVEEAIPASSWRIGVGVGAGAVVGGCIAFSSGRTIGAIVGLGTAVLVIAGWREHVPTFLAFFRKKAIWGMLLFVFLYRAGEGFLLVEAPLFMQSAVEKGGLGLRIEEKGLIDGTVSPAVSLLAGLLAGPFVSRYGLKRTLLLLAFFMNVPHLCYVYLSQAVSPGHPLSMTTILILVSIEKFGYSFGFVGNMLYMMQQIAPGKFKMTHYAYATALMNLVLIPTQAASGPLADWMGYRTFFLFVLVASIPSLLAAWKAPFPQDVAEEAEGAAPSDDGKSGAAGAV